VHVKLEFEKKIYKDGSAIKILLVKYVPLNSKKNVQVETKK
jgi:hypothetical protein